MKLNGVAEFVLCESVFFELSVNFFKIRQQASFFGGGALDDLFVRFYALLHISNFFLLTQNMDGRIVNVNRSVPLRSQAA